MSHYYKDQRESIWKANVSLELIFNDIDSFTLMSLIFPTLINQTGFSIYNIYVYWQPEVEFTEFEFIYGSIDHYLNRTTKTAKIF